MKRISFLLLFAFLISFLVSSCNVKEKAPMIKSERRFGKYIQQQTSQDTKQKVVDLSEGPRLRYDAHFGPKMPSFDFKIVNPY